MLLGNYSNDCKFVEITSISELNAISLRIVFNFDV